MVAEMTFGVPPNVTPATYLEIALQRIIEKDASRMMNMAIGKILGLNGVTTGTMGADGTANASINPLIGINGVPTSTCEFARLATYIFDKLECSDTVAIADVIKDLGLSVGLGGAMIDLLVDLNVLRNVDRKTVAFHSPHQKHTWILVKKDEIVSLTANQCQAVRTGKKQ